MALQQNKIVLIYLDLLLPILQIFKNYKTFIDKLIWIANILKQQAS